MSLVRVVPVRALIIYTAVTIGFDCLWLSVWPALHGQDLIHDAIASVCFIIFAVFCSFRASEPRS